ncbi:MAG TPA: G1 family glutamic endopeptidase [Solirubrobacteraceae bacterium]|jgi:hypothetical protein|nr:G1 family glutamic endopeptidase [Solirubrobacteraceae bacterium]
MTPSFLNYLRPPRSRVLLLAGLGALLAVPAAAGANTITSNNWSGYAVHRSGVSFERATATWRQPAAVCAAGTAAYSAFWVGIGGYSLSSSAMEQIGSELDCNADGSQSLSAWYELVPAPSRTIRITVAGGDLITASIAVAGKQVTMTLSDRTRHERFVKTVHVRTLDLTSAEWIAEAPSECSTATTCTTLPLADFGAVRFANASAQTDTGASASISSPLWNTTKILLGYSSAGTSFVAKTSTAHATPSALLSGGGQFLVSYSGASITAGSGAGGGGSSGGGGFGGGPGGGFAGG